MSIDYKCRSGEYHVGRRGPMDWVIVKDGEIVVSGFNSLSPAFTRACRLSEEDKNPNTIPWAT